MNTNIVCDENHNKCSVSKSILNKLMMLSLVFAISSTSILTFSGCSSEREQLKQNINQTTSIYAMKENNNSNHSYEEKENSSNCSNEEKLSYSQLLQKLNDELDKKNFSEEVNKLFTDTFEKLYKNYSTWQNGYEDMLSREQYVQNNLINVIKNIKDVKFYVEGSEEAQELLEETEGYPFLVQFSENKPIIKIVTKNEKDSSEDERNYYIEMFYHEVTHCKQNNILDYEYFEGYEEIEPIIIEGGATFHMKFVNPFTTDIGGAASITNQKENLIIDYNKENGLGYQVELNAYEKLVYMLGYDTMNKIENGEIPLSTLKKEIAQKYGKENANKMLKTMSKWYEEYSENWQGDEVYNLAIELEETFLDFIKQDISSLKTKDEVEEFMKKYERYKTKNLPQIMDEKYNNLTYEVFKINEIDEILSSKIQQFGIEDINTGYER